MPLINQSFVAEVGDLVKSLDFPGFDSCYVMGVVREKGMTPNGFEGYSIEPMIRMFDGKLVSSKDFPERFYVAFDTYTQGVFKV